MTQPAAPATESATAAIRGMSSPIETFGARIRRLRKARGMTPGQFAASLRVSVSAVEKWETNWKAPLLCNLCAIARLLSVSADYLLNGEKSPDHAALVRAVRIGASRKVMLALIGPDE